MKVVMPGGSGHLGQLLAQALVCRGDDVVVLSRSRLSAAAGCLVAWDGRSQGSWAHTVDGADAVINLAGRSVNCRYDKTNLTEMFASRVDSTRAVGQAIQHAQRPPRVWLQMSTATIYAHRFDAPNDELTGVIGGGEPDVPPYWRLSIEIALAWERELAAACTPATRKLALRRDGHELHAGHRLPDSQRVGTTRPRWTHRRRAAVRVVDPRSRFCPRRAVSARAGRSRGRDQYRGAGAAAAS